MGNREQARRVERNAARQAQIRKGVGSSTTNQSVEVEDEPVVPVVDPEAQKRHEKLKTELDDLLDNVDDILDVNAEEFVKTYVQKGGE